MDLVQGISNMNKDNYQTTKKERVAYALYFLGQNILWGFASLVATYLLDIGLDASSASAILLVPKIWDAVNDTLFGYVVDKVNIKKNQKFLPWIKIGTIMIGIVTVFMFAIPKGIDSKVIKTIWFLGAYFIFDAAYTMLDAPMYALPTVMTTNVQERTSLISSNRFTGIFGGAISSLLVPFIRPKTGWALGAIIFCSLGVAFMLPILFFGKERVYEKSQQEANYSFKEMWSYLKENKYLTISLLLIFIVGITSIETSLSLIMARNCFGSESKATVITAMSGLPIIFVSPFIPKLTKKFDKSIILAAGMIFGFVGSVASYIVGYDNFTLFIICYAIKVVGTGVFMVLSYMLIADSVEYGTYKSGVRATGISFSLQTFTSKLKNAVVGSVALFALGIFGYDSSLPETVKQAPQVISGIWKVFTLVPGLGYLASFVIIVVLYKLKDKDVEVMAKYNNGEISKEEATALLTNKNI